MKRHSFVIFLFFLLCKFLFSFGCQSSQLNPPIPIPPRQNTAKSQQFAADSISKYQPNVEADSPQQIPNYLTLDLENDNEGEEKLRAHKKAHQQQYAPSLNDAKNVENVAALDIVSANISETSSSTSTIPILTTTTPQNCNTARVLAVSTALYNEATIQQEFTSLMGKLGLLETFLGVKLASFGEYYVQPIQEGQYLALQIFYTMATGDCGQMRDFAAKTVSYSKEIEYAIFGCRCGEAWMISKVH